MATERRERRNPDRRRPSAAARRRRKQQRRRRMLSVMAAVLLLLIIVGSVVGVFLYKKYSLSKEIIDYNAFYNLEESNHAALIVDNEVINEQAQIIDGEVYIDTELLYQKFNSRFYWDSYENLLLYALPTELVTVPAGQKEYTVGKEKVSAGHAPVRLDGSTAYVSLDFIEKYTDLQYEYYEEPVPRVTVTTKFGSVETIEAKSDTQIRDKAGIKRPIMKQVKKGEVLYVVPTDEVIEGWTKVRSIDGFIGYVQDKRLSQTRGEEKLVSVYNAPEYTNISKDFTINMAWHQVTGVAGNDTVYKALADTKGLNVISPTWFFLKDDDGGIESLATESYVSHAHQNGLEVWGLVEDITYKDTIKDANIFNRTTSRQKLVSNLIAKAIQYDLDGLNLDCEYVNVESGRGYVEFIRELSIMCRINDITLSVDNYVPAEYNKCYNLAEQGVFADYVIIMGYDETPKASKQAGSVASLPYVTKGVEAALEDVPHEKLINAVPFYTRLWKISPSADEGSVDGYIASCEAECGMNTAEKYLEQNGATPNWSEEAGQYYGEYENGENTYRIWLEEETSIGEKAKLIKTYDLAGIAAWKLGFERSSIWDVILKYID